MDNNLILADVIESVPHPGDAHELVGHREFIAAFVEHFRSGRMHHAHLMSGPKGIGKATLSLRLAAYIFRNSNPEQIEPGSEINVISDSVQGMIAARSHPNLLHLTRPWDEKSKKFKTKLTIDEVRQTVPFFGKSRSENGWRIVIVDAIDDMNANASNALLKILEEPPDRTMFFLIAHSMGSVMPTIRSRCLHTALKVLKDDEILEVLNRFNLADDLSKEDRSLLVKLSNGSVRQAIVLLNEDGLALYKSFQQVITNAANPDWASVQAMADKIVQRGKEDRYNLLLGFARDFMREKATQTGEGISSLSSLARWAEVWEKTQKSTRTAESFNLDRKQVILNLFHEMSQAARVST